MFEEFSGKVLFVTGAGSGMGQHVAVRFAQLGCRIAVTARRPEKADETLRLIQEAGGEGIYVYCDTAEEASVRRAVEETVRTYGAIDYAFNNAGCGADGVNIPFAPLAEVTEADWQKVIDTNLTGTFHCLKYEILQMKQQDGGAIVNTSSIGGLKMAPGFGAYGPSKAGINALTQLAAIEYGKDHIRVNAICPGPTMGTNLMKDSIESGHQDVAFMEQNVIPDGRMGTTDDIADAVLFLCSSRSSHITGELLPVCGGMQV